MSIQRLVVVELDTFRVGLDVQRVVEVLKVLSERPVVPIPGSPPAISGLVNLRGQVLSVISARTVLGLPPSEDTRAVHVVIRSGANMVLLAADREHGLVDVALEHRLEAPGNFSAALAAAVVGVHTLDDGLLLELDIDWVLSAATGADAAAVGAGRMARRAFGNKGGTS